MNFKPPSVSELKFSEETEEALRKEPYLARKLATVARELHQLRLDSRTQQVELLPYYADREVGYKLGTASWLEASKKALVNEATPAGVLLVAAKNVLGPGVLTYEPDTIRTELEDREKLTVPAVNYDKLLAAITIRDVPAFYFEVLTFQNTVLAFNHEYLDPEVVVECSPAQISWGVYEAELILQEDGQSIPSFDNEPTIYTATVLHRAGFVAAPTLLAFAQAELDKLNSKELNVKDVRAAWDKLNKSTLASHTFEETPLGIQLAKLAAVELYVRELAEEYDKAIRTLRDAP